MIVTEPSRSTADLIVECLENEGVTHVFGIPGEENIRLVEAISRSSIRYVLTRHEQGASFMAETYGRLTGRAGVCSATLGPGAINLLLGTADATTNSTPLIALSAQVGMNRSFKESHQGVDLVSMFAPVTKWSALVATPGAVPEMIRKAFKLAQTERPGAVYLAIPEDVEKTAAPGGQAPLAVNVPRPDEPSRGQIERAAALLRDARAPVVLAGHGAARAGAGKAVRRFAETLGVPVATTFHGKGVFPDDHPLALGAVGFMRHDYANFGFSDADIRDARRAELVLQHWSLDAPLGGRLGAASLGDLLGEEDPQVEHMLGMRAVATHWQELPCREQKILVMRFCGDMTQSQVGQQLGISQMHVSRLLAHALGYLRPRLLGLPERASGAGPAAAPGADLTGAAHRRGASGGPPASVPVVAVLAAAVPGLPDDDQA